MTKVCSRSVTNVSSIAAVVIAQEGSKMGVDGEKGLAEVHASCHKVG
jgi:hypothetical protein